MAERLGVWGEMAKFADGNERRENDCGEIRMAARGGCRGGC